MNEERKKGKLSAITLSALSEVLTSNKKFQPLCSNTPRVTETVGMKEYGKTLADLELLEEKHREVIAVAREKRRSTMLPGDKKRRTSKK